MSYPDPYPDYDDQHKDKFLEIEPDTDDVQVPPQPKPEGLHDEDEFVNPSEYGPNQPPSEELKFIYNWIMRKWGTGELYDGITVGQAKEIFQRDHGSMDPLGTNSPDTHYHFDKDDDEEFTPAYKDYWDHQFGDHGIDEGKSKNSPWAICTNSVGRENKKKYERCIMSVKKKTHKESTDPVQQIAEMLTDDPDVMVGDFDDEQSDGVGTLTAEPPPVAEPVAEPAQDLDVNEFDVALDRILADMGVQTGGPTTKPEVEPETMPDVDPGAPGAPTEPSEPDPFTPTRPAVMPEPKANRY